MSFLGRDNSACQPWLVTPWVKEDQLISILSEEDDHHIPAPRIPVLLGFHITENKLISLSGSQNFARCYWFQDFVLHHGGQIEKDYKTHPNRKRSTSRLYIVTLLI